MTQPTDEAAVDAEIFAAAWKAYEQWNERDQPCPNDTIDCAAVAYIAIQNERAQLTAATRRAEILAELCRNTAQAAELRTAKLEQAERMLTAATEALEWTEGVTSDSYVQDKARATLTTIRSAASGEQG